MEELTAYLTEKKYKVIDLTQVMTLKSYSKYVESLINKPEVIAYFKKNDDNAVIFKMCNAMSTCNYYFINKDNYIFTSINDKLENHVKLCINKFLKEETDCGICLDKKDNKRALCKKCAFAMCPSCVKQIIKTKMTNQIDCPQCNQEAQIIWHPGNQYNELKKSNIDEIKKYVHTKDCTFEDITELVNEQNFSKYMTEFKENNLLIIRRNKNTEFVFVLQGKNIQEDITNHNMILIGYGGCMTIKWKNKLEHEHKQKINIIIGTDKIIKCNVCLIKKENAFNICKQCNYKICAECIQKIKTCPGCK